MSSFFFLFFLHLLFPLFCHQQFGNSQVKHKERQGLGNVEGHKLMSGGTVSRLSSDWEGLCNVSGRDDGEV